MTTPEERAVWIRYTNWKGETEVRHVRPHGSLIFDRSPWHPEPQWLMLAWDLERRRTRTFALSGIHAWATSPDDPRLGAGRAAAPPRPGEGPGGKVTK